MGKEITLYCEETPQLKLGPGISVAVRTVQLDGDTPPLEAGQVIEFHDGFATFDEAEYPKWLDWVYAPGTPFIRIVDEGAGEATSAAACSRTSSRSRATCAAIRSRRQTCRSPGTRTAL